MDVVGATHTHFANVCAIGNWLIAAGLGQDQWPAIGAAALLGPYANTCGPDAFPIGEVLRIQNIYAVSFFKRFLHDDTGYESYLLPSYAANNLPDVVYATKDIFLSVYELATQ